MSIRAARPRRPILDRTLNLVLEQATNARPDHRALGDKAGWLTYSELFARASQLGGGYHRLGVESGEPVLLMLDNTVDSALAWLGLSFNASLETLVNTAYKGSFLAHLIRDSGARCAVVEQRYLAEMLAVHDDLLETIVVRPDPDAEPITAVAASTRARIVLFEELLTHPARGPQKVSAWDPLAILYTSGTTGVARGALLSHAAAYTTAEFTGQQGPDDVRYVVAPQFHVAGQWGGIYCAWIPGSTAYIADGFHATTFWDEARTVGATTTQLVGTMPEFLLRQPPRPSDADNPVREVYMTPVTSAVTEFRTRFGVSVATGFGSTECGTILVDLDDEAVAPRRCGLPHPDMEVRLVDEHDIEVPDGQPGQAVVRPKLPWIVMSEWHGRPDRTVESWRNGWLHSGDALIKDENGVFRFVDRVDDAIRRRGENVSSYEVEVAVTAHPEVVESAAIGVPSEFSEDEIKILVIRCPGATVTEADLIRYLADHMPYFAVPRFIEFVEDLPRTPTHKVKKAELRAAGVGKAWDREQAGLTVTRTGLRVVTEA